ncbi:MAG: ABC transporter permease [Bacteroidales bacterium]
MDLKLYFRNLFRHKVFSAITIGSFAASLAVVVVLASFLASEFGYDKHIADIDLIFRVAGPDNEAGIREEARKLLVDNLPEIESATNYMTSGEPVVYGESTVKARVIHSEEGIFSVLPIVFLSGNPEGLFDERNNVVITESLARKIFGDDNPLGRQLNISHREDVIIAGVINDFPEKSTLNGDIICHTDLKLRYWRSCFDVDDCEDYYKLLVKLHPMADWKEVSSKISYVIPRTRHSGEDDISSLLPFKNVYFDTTLNHDDLEHANIKLIWLLVWLTIILLFLAVFNYVNLSIAQSLTRLREFGMKKVLGLGKASLVRQFIAEAFITVVISLCIAVYLGIFIKPVFEGMLDKTIRIQDLVNSPVIILSGILILIVISVLPALYPAGIALRVKAGDLISKRMSGKSGGYNFRKTLNVVQFAASIAIIVSLLVISKQVEYVKTKDFGFDTQQLVRIPVHWQAGDKVEVLIDLMNSFPNVVDACYSHGTPGGIHNYSANEEFGRVAVIASDHRFMETFGIPIAEGRNFYPSEENDVCLINRKAMREAGWETFEGKRMFGSEVIGIFDDFHYQDMYHEIGSLMIHNEKYFSHITARIEPHNISYTIDQLKNGFQEILPEFEFSFEFYDEYLGGMYRQEERRASSLKIVAFIALLISSVGLYGLANFSTKSRIKEIGIRKVNGAKVWEVMAMLNFDFVKWVALAFVVAVPVAWYAMSRWLQSFAYKTELSWWIFAFAGLMALIIALLTVSWQSWKAARRNPVEALRYE